MIRRSSILFWSTIFAQPFLAHGAQRIDLRAQLAYGQDPAFSALVEADSYSQALDFACRKFMLPCDRHRIRINASDDGSSYATTHPYTDTIRISPSAFRYLGRPHPGWLAALISHEIVHTRQSRYIRSIVVRTGEKLLKDFYWTSVLELEAWSDMMTNADRFRLNCAMRLEIHDNLFYFSKILGDDGKGPLNEQDEVDHYQLNDAQRRALDRQCELDLAGR